MTYQSAIEKHGKKLRATVQGENSYENISRFLQELLEKCEEEQTSHLLIVDRMSGLQSSTVDVYELVSEYSAKGFYKLEKVAYCDLAGDPENDIGWFAETVALNQGVNIKLFRNLEKAEEWLDG